MRGVASGGADRGWGETGVPSVGRGVQSLEALLVKRLPIAMMVTLIVTFLHEIRIIC